MDPKERTQIIDRLEQVESKVDRILFYIDNDTRTGKVGIVQGMEIVKKEIHLVDEKVEKVIKAQKEKSAFKKGVNWVVGVIIGAGLWLIDFLFRLFGN